MQKKEIGREIVVEAMKKIAKILNFNLIRNTDHLLSKIDMEPVVHWVWKDSIRIDSSKYNITFQSFSETIAC